MAPAFLIKPSAAASASASPPLSLSCPRSCARVPRAQLEESEPFRPMASRPRWIPCVRPGAKKFPRLLFSAFDPWPRRAGQIDRRRLLLAAAPAAVSACRRSRLAVAAGGDFFIGAFPCATSPPAVGRRRPRLYFSVILRRRRINTWLFPRSLGGHDANQVWDGRD